MRVLAVALAVVVAACSANVPAPSLGPEAAARRDALVTAVREAQLGDTINLRSALGTDWDRAMVIGPYSDNASARDLLGFDFDLEGASPWTSSEGGVVVVLARGTDVVAWFTLPSSTVGLHCLEDASIPSDHAMLTVTEEPGGFRELGDAQHAICPGPRSSTAASPAPASSATPGAGLTGFDAAVAAAIEKAKAIPLDGSVLTGGTPTCQALYDAATQRHCAIELSVANPVASTVVMSLGSVGGAAMLMVAAEMPDGIEGTVLPAPTLGDDARLARSWGDRGCSGVLAVRDGTLVLSVQVRLASGATTADCGLEVPADYLEAVARSLIGDLGAFRALGLPIDDLAARDRVVSLIKDGTLKPGERDIVELPPEFANLSDGGEVVAMREGNDWTIVFFEVRALLDNYSGWVYRSSGRLGRDEDPLGGELVTRERIDKHWFHVQAT